MSTVADVMTRSLSHSISNLDRYCGGLMHVWDTNGQHYWAKLESVDKWRGVFVQGYCHQGKSKVVWSKVSFSIAGVMSLKPFDPIEIFGMLAEDENKVLQHAYKPVDPHGMEIESAKPFINVFYLPGSDQVPQEIRELFAEKK